MVLQGEKRTEFVGLGADACLRTKLNDGASRKRTEKQE
jgi:hypothetical protein